MPPKRLKRKHALGVNKTLGKARFLWNRLKKHHAQGFELVPELLTIPGPAGTFKYGFTWVVLTDFRKRELRSWGMRQMNCSHHI